MNTIILPENRFDEAVKFVLSHEGGLSDDKNDPGGLTKYGISIRLLKNLNLDLNHDDIINRKDILDLTIPLAKEIYKKEWWDKYNYQSINNFIVARKIFDSAVNMGGLQAHKLVQRAINKIRKIPIEVNGSFSQKTIDDLNFIELHDESKLFLLYFRSFLKLFYESLVNVHPKLGVFLHGWLTRASE